MSSWTFKTVDRVVLFFCLIASLFCKTEACNGMGLGDKKMNNKSVVILKKQDNGKEINVKCGDVIQVELEGLGSSGYWWYVGKMDAQYVELISEEKRIQSEGKIGAPVLGIWTFRAKERGVTEIRIDHYRKWEDEEKSTDHFWIKVCIQ